MKSEQEILIEGYLNNTLTALQQQEFGRLMGEDRQFAEEVAFHEKMKTAIRLEERQNLKARFDALDASPHPTKLWWYAAAAVFVLGVIGWWTSTLFPQNSEDLYHSYFEPYPNTVDPIVRSDAGQSGLSDQAFEWYDKGDYDKASAAFGDLYKHSQRAQDLFYQAVALMASGHHAEAIPLLEQQKKDGSFFEAAQWYLGLAYLKDGQVSKAKTHLEKVRDSGGFLSPQAVKLLDELGE